MQLMINDDFIWQSERTDTLTLFHLSSSINTLFSGLKVYIMDGNNMKYEVITTLVQCC